MSFRAHQSAAPLKRVIFILIVGLPFELPRSPERGPIEASRLLVSFAIPAAFRAHQSAAPLKRFCGAVVIALAARTSALTRARPH